MPFLAHTNSPTTAPCLKQACPAFTFTVMEIVGLE